MKSLLKMPFAGKPASGIFFFGIFKLKDIP